MSYRVIFKGQIPDEFVEETIGRSLSSMWEDNSLASRVKINGNLYESSSIKAILSGFQNPDSSDKDDMMKMIDETKREHQAGIDGLLRQSPEQRAQNTGLAELAYTTLVKKSMPQELKDQIIARQQAFFEENPNWAHANPACYRDLLPKHEVARDFHISNTLTLSGLNLIERVVQSGIKA